MKKSRFHKLSYEMCVKFGCCTPSIINDEIRHVEEFLPQSGIVSADQYIETLIAADGGDAAWWRAQPDAYKDAYRAVFVKHMGAAAVDASLLRRSAKT